MSKKNQKGLKLSTETLRNLAPESLGRAVGGTFGVPAPSLLCSVLLRCSGNPIICTGPSPWSGASNSNGGISNG